MIDLEAEARKAKEKVSLLVFRNDKKLRKGKVVHNSSKWL